MHSPISPQVGRNPSTAFFFVPVAEAAPDPGADADADAGSDASEVDSDVDVVALGVPIPDGPMLMVCPLIMVVLGVEPGPNVNVLPEIITILDPTSVIVTPPATPIATPELETPPRVVDPRLIPEGPIVRVSPLKTSVWTPNPGP